MANGWVKLHRKILEWEFYNDMPVRSVFIHLLLKAEFETVVSHGITVQRGQALVTVKGLAEDLKITEKQVRRAFTDLQKYNAVMVEGTNKHSLLTIVNYDGYQDSEQDSDTSKKGRAKGRTKTEKKGEQNSIPPPSKLPFNNDTYDDDGLIYAVKRANKNNKKGRAKGRAYTIDKKEERKEESVHAPHLSFEVFWDGYDKKVDRYKCEKLWAALSDDDKAAIIEHVPRYVASCPEAQYRKNPQTYLNGKCWNDDIIFRGNHAHNSTTRRNTTTPTPSRGTGTIADYIANEQQWGFASSVASEPNFRQTGS